MPAVLALLRAPANCHSQPASLRVVRLAPLITGSKYAPSGLVRALFEHWPTSPVSSETVGMCQPSGQIPWVPSNEPALSAVISVPNAVEASEM